jgi:hypothetical protein
MRLAEAHAALTVHPTDASAGDRVGINVREQCRSRT